VPEVGHPLEIQHNFSIIKKCLELHPYKLLIFVDTVWVIIGWFTPYKSVFIFMTFISLTQIILQPGKTPENADKISVTSFFTKISLVTIMLIHVFLFKN